ncbi:GMC oxidoreductase [Burkholderia sp. Ac-20344]|uniref:GMC oxidoreductase n=1 Tax=Burkholderia sp. Ac-20344 TaxID=2703890 RepID=UPI001F1225B5|nr:GMC oxidoreductase [Burkholderia sp. Ac-20344]
MVDIITGVEIVRPRVRGGSCVGVVARSADGLIQIDANATLLAAGALSNTEILMQADQAGHPTFRASSALGRYLSDHYRFLVTVENVNARELSRWLHGYSQHEYIRRGAAIDLGIQADLRLVSASIYLSSLNGTTAKFNVEVEQPPEFENRLEFSPKGLTARFLPGETVLTTLTYAVEHLLEDLHVPSSARSMLEDHIRKNATQLTTISHPSGTTRMGPSPDKSVVNSHLQVHGVSGLYVCGASVFPTAGVCNPTLTSIALALRFVDHALGRTAPRRIKSELAK